MGCSELSREPQVDIVFRFEEFIDIPEYFGILFLDKKDMAYGILARGTGGTACFPEPCDKLPDVIPFKIEYALSHAVKTVGAARVHPDNGVHQGITLFVNRYGSAPLCRAAYRDNIVRRNQAF